MSSYIRPAPSHSGLTALFGGNDKTGEYYHLTPQQHAFVGPLSSGSTSVSATTFYSGSSELGGLLSFNGVLSVSPGLNAYTGGTLTRPILGLLGDVVLTSITSVSLSALTVRFDDSLLDASVGNSDQFFYYKNDGLVRTNPVMYYSSGDSAVFSNAFYSTILSAETVFLNSVDITSVFATKQSMTEFLPKSGGTGGPYVLTGTTSIIGNALLGSVTGTTTSVIGWFAFHNDVVSIHNTIPATAVLFKDSGALQVMTGDSSFSYNKTTSGLTAVNISGATLYSGITELSVALSNKFNSAYAPISVQNQWVQPGNNTSTGGTPNAPSVNLVVSPSVFNLISSGVTYAPIISGGTLYSGNTDISHLLGQGGASTYVQPGTNISTGGTPSSPVVSLSTDIIVDSVITDDLQVNRFAQFSSDVLYNNNAYVLGNITFTGGSALFIEDIARDQVLHAIPVVGKTYQRIVGNPQFRYVPEDDFLTAGNMSADTITFGFSIRDNGPNSLDGYLYTNQGGLLVANQLYIDPFTNSFVVPAGLSAQTYYSGTSELGSLFAPISVTPTYVRPGINTYTGGTISRPVVGVVGSPVFTGVTSQTISGTSITATTFSSGATELSVALSNKFNSVYAPISVQNQWMQPGNNTTTGGTPNAPSVNLVASPSVFNLISSGVTYAPIISGGTLYSGNTDLSHLLGSVVGGLTSYVQPGTNITTGGTASAPIVHVAGSPVFTAVTAIALSGTSVSATTFSSGATELSVALSNKFNSAYAPISVQNQWMQPGNNITTGGTPNAPSVSLVASPSVFNLTSSGVTFAPTLSGNTLYSGASELGGLMAQFFAPISVVPTYVQPGSNITTGGTASRPIVHVLGSPTFTGVTSQTLSGTSVSATTFFSGSTNIGSIFSPFNHTHVSSAITDSTYGGNYSADADLLLKVNADGGISLSSSATTPAIITFNPYFTSIQALSTDGYGVEAASVNLAGAYIESINDHGLHVTSVNGPGALIVTTDAGNIEDILNLHNNSATGLNVKNDGGLQWTTPTGAATTRTNLGISALFVAPGANAYTASTVFNTIVGVVGSPVFTGVTAQSISGTSISATTYYSGSTPLNTILSSLAGGTPTYVQPGSNITTGGTASRPVVGVLGSPTFTGVTAQTISGTSVSATTFFSGSTNIGSLFAPASTVATYVSPGFNAYTGGTITRPIVGVIGSPVFTAVTASSVSGTSISATTYFSGSTDIGSLFAPASLVSTYVQPGTNIATGGTASRPVVHVVGSPVFTGVTASSLSGTSVSATTYFSGSTELGSLFAGSTPTYVQPGLNITTGGTASRPIIHVIGSPVFTAVTASSISGTSVSATTYFSGSTELGSLFAPASVLATRVSPGVNTYTGGTVSNPIVGVIGSPTFTGVTSQTISGTSVSATTYYSGSTNLGSLFAPASVVATLVQPGSNIATGGTASRPIIHVIGSPIFTAVTASSISGTSVSATTYFSGSTELGSLFAPASVVPTYVQPGTNIVTGGTASRPIVHVLGSPIFTGVTAQSVSGTSISATTLFSGSTELGTLFAPSSTVATYVQPGVNAYTGGTASRPIVGVIGSPVFTGVTAQSISGTSISATTFFSGSAELGSLFAPASVTATLVQPGTNIATGGTSSRPVVHVIGSPVFTAVTASSLSGTSVSATTYFSGSTELGSLFAPISVVATRVSPGINAYTAGTASNPIVGIIGSPVFTAVTASSISGTSVSGNTYFSGATDLGGLFAPVSVVPTYVQPGTNIATGGTASRPVVHVVGSPVFTAVTTSSLSGTSVSATTYFSGATELGSLFAGSTPTYVQPGTNIATGGTASRPVVHVVGSPVFTAVTTSSLSGTSVSATTYFSGATELGSLFAGSTPTYVQPGLNITTGGTITRPIVGLQGDISVTSVTVSSHIRDNGSTTQGGIYFKDTASNNIINSNRLIYNPIQGLITLNTGLANEGMYVFDGGFTGVTIQGNIISSGSTNIQDLFAPISASATYVQPGSNITTGGTDSRPVVHVVGSPVFTGVTASSVSGTSVSATTYFSGSTNIGTVFAAKTHSHTGGITFIMDGGASVISTGQKGYLIAPYSGIITGWTIVSDVIGSIVVDVWKDTYANYPPTVADTIAGSEKPTLSSVNKNSDSNLSTWTTQFSMGDIFTINVDSVSTVTKVTLLLHTIKLD